MGILSYRKLVLCLFSVLLLLCTAIAFAPSFGLTPSNRVLLFSETEPKAAEEPLQKAKIEGKDGQEDAAEKDKDNAEVEKQDGFKLFAPMKRAWKWTKQKVFRRGSTDADSEEVEGDTMFSHLKGSRLARLRGKRNVTAPVTIAEVDVYVKRLFETTNNAKEDIDKLLDALKNLDRLLWSNGTLWEVAREFTGSWRIATTNATMDEIHLRLFPFLIRNISLAVRSQEDNTEFVRFYGDFEVNYELKKLEFRFDDMAVLGLRGHLAQKRIEKGMSLFGWTETETDEDDLVNVTKKRPFSQKIRTNRTSEAMKKVLGWFDEWYSVVIPDTLGKL